MTGKSIIELTNVNTGETRKYEDKNMITNAVQERLTAWLAYFPRAAIQTKAFPLYSEMFGGILLYSDPLEENPNNYDLPDPSVSRLVGHAGKYVTTGDNKMRGSRNTTESGFINDGKAYKYVYDFATDEANGQISALSLTHEIMGYYGNYISWKNLCNQKDAVFPTTLYEQSNAYYNGSYYGLYNTTNYDIKFGFDLMDCEKIKNGNKISYILTYVNMINSTTIRIDKYEVYISDIRLNNRLLYDKKLISREDIPITIEIYDNYFSESKWYYINTNVEDENYYYFVYVKSYNSDYDKVNQTYYPRANIYYIRMDKNTHEIIQGKKIVNYNLSDIYNSNSNGKSYKYIPSFVARNGSLYFKISYSSYNGDNKNKVLKFNIDSDEITILETNYKYKSDYYNTMSKTANNTIITNGYLIDLNDNLIPSEKFYGGVQSVRNNYDDDDYYYNAIKFVHDFISLKYYRNSGHYEHIYPNICYLGTINNLDTPIIKSNQETMKITYILEEEE